MFLQNSYFKSKLNSFLPENFIVPQRKSLQSLYSSSLWSVLPNTKCLFNWTTERGNKINRSKSKHWLKALLLEESGEIKSIGLTSIKLTLCHKLVATSFTNCLSSKPPLSVMKSVQCYTINFILKFFGSSTYQMLFWFNTSSFTHWP